MLNRLAAILIVLSFISPAVAGGIQCAAGSGCEGIAQMACCAQAKSAAAPPAAVICCQLVCGETTGSTPITQPEAAAHPQDFAPPLKTISFEPSDEVSAALVAVFVRSAGASILHRDPPHIYLHNSAFLI